MRVDEKSRSARRVRSRTEHTNARTHTPSRRRSNAEGDEGRARGRAFALRRGRPVLAPVRPSLDDDGELNTNPPTPCQISKRPPAPKPKRESAGHQGVAGGGYLWSHAALSCRGVFVEDLAGARVGGEGLGGPVGG